MVTKEKIVYLGRMAGFEYSHEGKDFVCFGHDDANSYKFILSQYKKLSDSVQTEEDVLSRLFYECKRIGRIQARQELAKIISLTNYD